MEDTDDSHGCGGRAQLTERVKRMIDWLVENMERISQPEKINVSFDCAGGAINAEIKQREKL